MITKEQALEALESMDDFARMADVDPVGPYRVLKDYIEQLEAQLDRRGLPQAWGYFNKKTGTMDGFLDISAVEKEGHAWPDTHDALLLYTAPPVPEIMTADKVEWLEDSSKTLYLSGWKDCIKAMLAAQEGS